MRLLLQFVLSTQHMECITTFNVDAKQTAPYDDKLPTGSEHNPLMEVKFQEGVTLQFVKMH